MPAIRILTILTWVVAYLGSLVLYGQWMCARDAEYGLIARGSSVRLLGRVADRLLLAGVAVAWLMAAWGPPRIGPFWCLELQCLAGVVSFEFARRYGLVYGGPESDAPSAATPASLGVPLYLRWPDPAVRVLTAVTFLPVLAAMAIWSVLAARSRDGKPEPSPEEGRQR